ncbi:hypothetical protein HJ526_17330 [Donghicola sp. C2-DW-16]|uniref:asparagine synthase (glutamine-hydrolyzing) n=1 Tax=Donghicola mangrovi TaxID=2729614 RepID=A0ABX2PI43_9RHOB|nr:asparagine synthase-related protein [Donghicola mangrovi]NVO29187.1 hypothetical protein [Donghicola mangrovi]
MVFTVEFRFKNDQSNSVPFGFCLKGNFRYYSELSVAGTFDLGNLKHLSEQLGLPAGSPPEHCIIAGYQKWGEAILSHLSGEFAFVLWSPQEHWIFAARDRFGVHPLSFRQEDDYFSVSSHPEHLSSGKLNHTWVSQFLTGIISDPALTPFEGVKRILPGTLLTADVNGHASRKWYHLTPRHVPENEAAEAIRAALADAVKRMSPPDTVSLLSGGLDSSALTLLLGLQAKDRVNAVSLVYPHHPTLDETSYIDAVLGVARNVRGRRFPLTVRDFDADITQVLIKQGQPVNIANPATIMMAYYYAGKVGAKSILDGHGGDEVIGSGLWYLPELMKRGDYLALWSSIRAYKSRVGNAHGQINLLNILASLAPQKISRIMRKLRLVKADSNIYWRRLVDETLVRESGLVRSANEAFGSAQFHLEGQEQFHAQLCLSPQTDRGFEILRRFASYEGADVKFPLYDQDVVELCVGQSAKVKFGAGLTRNLIREALRGIYPEPVRTRTSKVDFTPFVIDSLLNSETVRSFRDGVPENLRPFVSDKGLSDMINDLDNSQNLSVVASEAVRLVQLYQWLSVMGRDQKDRRTAHHSKP